MKQKTTNKDITIDHIKSHLYTLPYDKLVDDASYILSQDWDKMNWRLEDDQYKETVINELANKIFTSPNKDSYLKEIGLYEKGGGVITSSPKFKKHLALAKMQILEDIKNKEVPKDIKSFRDLHDYVDANDYGGFTEEGYIPSNDFIIENAIQNELDIWIKNGMPNNSMAKGGEAININTKVIPLKQYQKTLPSSSLLNGVKVWDQLNYRYAFINDEELNYGFPSKIFLVDKNDSNLGYIDHKYLYAISDTEGNKIGDQPLPFTIEKTEDEDIQNRINHYKNLLKNIDKYPNYSKEKIKQVISELESQTDSKVFRDGGEVDTSEINQKALKDGYVFFYSTNDWDDYRIAKVAYEKTISRDMEFTIYFNGTYVHTSKTYSSLIRKLTQMKEKWNLKLVSVKQDTDENILF